ncbi:MAG: hypothetical protein Q4E13_12315 [Clostridia bacterium]|nr:hypothetical protein [Clostridia bacterium]
MKRRVSLILILCLLFCNVAAAEETEWDKAYEAMWSDWEIGETLKVDGICEVTVTDVKFAPYWDIYESLNPSKPLDGGPEDYPQDCVEICLDFKNISSGMLDGNEVAQNLKLQAFQLVVDPIEWKDWDWLCDTYDGGPDRSYDTIRAFDQEVSWDAGEDIRYLMIDNSAFLKLVLIYAVLPKTVYNPIPLALEVYNSSNGGNRIRVNDIGFDLSGTNAITDEETLDFLKWCLYPNYMPDKDDWTTENLIKAVKKIQKAKGLEVTGNIDERPFTEILKYDFEKYDLTSKYDLGE